MNETMFPKLNSTGVLAKEIKNLREEVKRLRGGIESAIHALRSYQYGNSDIGLARAVADKLEGEK